MNRINHSIETDPAVHFTGALATNAAEQEHIALAPPLSGFRNNARGIVQSLAIISKENLDWELILWGNSTCNTADPATDSFIGRWSFVAADAVRVAGANLYYYYIDGLAVPYRDDDQTGELHVSLLNRSAAAKSAGAAGALKVIVRIELPVD